MKNTIMRALTAKKNMFRNILVLSLIFTLCGATTATYAMPMPVPATQTDKQKAAAAKAKEAEKKKKTDFSKVEFLTIKEGLCVQCMHIGPFDDEPETVAKMDQFLLENGYENDFSEGRLHHEIYLSDARRVAPEKWKTVIRHPVKRTL